MGAGAVTEGVAVCVGDIVGASCVGKRVLEGGTEVVKVVGGGREGEAGYAIDAVAAKG